MMLPTCFSVERTNFPRINIYIMKSNENNLTQFFTTLSFQEQREMYVRQLHEMERSNETNLPGTDDFMLVSPILSVFSQNITMMFC